MNLHDLVIHALKLVINDLHIINAVQNEQWCFEINATMLAVTMF